MNNMDINDYNNQCAQLFEEGVCAQNHGEMPIMHLHNGKDCFILDVPEKVERLFRKHFMLGENERILLARDTSTWNRRNEGLIITDRRIVYIPSKHGDNGNLYIVRPDARLHVNCNATSILFWGDNQGCLSIPKRFFLKTKWRSYDFDSCASRLASLLEEMGQIVPQQKGTPFLLIQGGRISKGAYNADKYAVR